MRTSMHRMTTRERQRWYLLLFEILVGVTPSRVRPPPETLPPQNIPISAQNVLTSTQSATLPGVLLSAH